MARSNYWNYYEDDFDWDDTQQLVRPDLTRTRSCFAALGFSDAEILALINSGYVVLENDVVVDRFHGGLLASIDGRTRFPLGHFRAMMSEGRNRVTVHDAKSKAEVLDLIDRLRHRSSRPLAFRGQIKAYPLERERPNPSLQVAGVGEVSLLPSLWRAMRLKKPASYLEFINLSLFEWSRVIYAGFDLDEIARREEAINAGGGWMHSMQDMEDSDDPLLQEFGRTRLDLAMGMDFNLAAALSTYLQHYGLYSPVLDLTTDPEVALFFASHRFRRGPQKCEYEFVGSNDGSAVIYVFRQDPNEMHAHRAERFVERLPPLRPDRQACVICGSRPWAMNLPADLLVAIVRLDFDLQDKGALGVGHLFPSAQEDRFLHALKNNLSRGELVTDFSGTA